MTNLSSLHGIILLLNCSLSYNGVYGCKYTPLYEKGIKETQNRAMETTSVLLLFPILVV